MYYTVAIVGKPGPTTSFAEFLECAFEVSVYFMATANWPDPLLPPQPGCPALVSDTEIMEDMGSGWICLDKM